MKKISIAFSITYDRCELSTGEHNPEIYAYLDARFKRSQIPVKFTPDENDNAKAYNGQVSGYISERALVNGGIPPNAALVFTHYAWRPNQWGSMELQGAGMTHISLGEMMSQPNFSKELPLLMHTINNKEKGQILFQLHALETSGMSVSQPIFISQYNGMQAQINKIVNTVVGYSNQVMKIRSSIPDARAGMERIAMPYNLSDGAFEATSGVPLPAFSYVLAETPESNHAFWSNALEQVMRRDGLLVSDFFSFNTLGKARTMANMLVYVPTMLNYVSDTVLTDNRMEKGLHRMQKQGIELFGDSLGPALSGDCEDLGTGIMQCHDALLQHQFPDTPKYDALREIQALGSQYMYFLSLAAVQAAHIQDNSKGIGAHCHGVLVSVKQAKKVIENTPEGAKISNQLPWPSNLDQHEDLPFMILEGTGPYETLGVDAEKVLMPIKAYVYQGTPSMGGDKKPIGHAANEKTNFFLSPLMGLTSYFYKRGSPYVGFWYTNQYGQRGSNYADMVANKVEKWGLRPHPRIPPLLKKVVNEAILLRQPPLPLTLSPETAHPVKNKHLDYIKAHIDGLQRKPLNPKHGIISVPVYIRPENINEDLAKAHASELQRLKNVVGVDYDLEEATDQIYAYRLMVHVGV